MFHDKERLQESLFFHYFGGEVIGLCWLFKSVKVGFPLHFSQLKSFKRNVLQQHSPTSWSLIANRLVRIAQSSVLHDFSHEVLELHTAISSTAQWWQRIEKRARVRPLLHFLTEYEPNLMNKKRPGNSQFLYCPRYRNIKNRTLKIEEGTLSGSRMQ